MRKYQKMQAIIMCGALVASSTSVLAAKGVRTIFGPNVERC